MIEQKNKTFLYLAEQLSIFPFILFLISCSDQSFNNTCDINSKAYIETSLLITAIGQKTHPCYPGIQIVSDRGINLSDNFLTLSEAGGTTSYGSSFTLQVFLGTEPKDDVNIQVIVGNPSFAFVSQTNLFFSKSNWNQSQSTVITAVNDTVINGTHSTLIRFVPNSNDTSFPLNEKFVQAEILDNDKIIFLTSVGLTGAFGGVPGVDNVCQTNANCPIGKVCKGMVGDSFYSLRRASVTANLGDGQIDWVLKPNASYFRQNRTDLIATTNNVSLFTFNLLLPISGSSSTAWTGINPNWTNNGNNCDGWTVTGTNGYGGDTGSSTSTALGFNSFGCTSGLLLYCVEQ
ncbi:DUF1554 domain-containing protein [Leptospira jelokensis]|uniref:DUF1554 domain-containing protein n=1 Tax=Leptospira jelokensis TaxID=2484931 RepID=UPI001090FB09|nr:DUF1554 domain-containing protein [Leptospira jelokensis]TGM01524.1 DUF1554 domain-containing protein [Leptospira jelokensis]